MIDDKRRETVAAFIEFTLKRRVVNIRVCGQQRRSVIIKP